MKKAVIADCFGCNTNVNKRVDSFQSTTDSVQYTERILIFFRQNRSVIDQLTKPQMMMLHFTF